LRAPVILVVEDDPIVRNLAVRALTERGFRVFEADTAAEALIVCRSLTNQTIDLVITDHTLAQTTGRELAEQILAECAKVKILQLSAWPFSRMQEENALVPGSSFLQKPFSGAQLITAVESILTPRTQ
jgi:two-component system, cell cycle sensor histidine kinase and response regulator CckA